MGVKPEAIEAASQPANDETSPRRSKGWLRELLPELLVAFLGETATLVLLGVGAVATVGGAVVVATTYGLVYLILVMVILAVLAVIGWIMSWFG